MNFNGLQIIFHIHALDAIEVRLFPNSRHRSNRIRKKLVRQFGGEFRMQPCISRYRDCIVAHLSFRTQFEAATRVQR